MAQAVSELGEIAFEVCEIQQWCEGVFGSRRYQRGRPA